MEKIILEVLQASISLTEVFLLYFFVKPYFKKRFELPLFTGGTILLTSALVIELLTAHLNFASKLISVILISFIYLHIMFKGKWLKKLIYALVYIFIASLIEDTIIMLAIVALGFSLQEAQSVYSWTQIQLAFLAKFSIFSVICIINNHRDKLLKQVPIKIWMMMVVIFTISISVTVGIMRVRLKLSAEQGKNLAILFFLMELLIFLANIVIYIIVVKLNLYLNKSKDYEVMQYKNEMLIRQAKEKEESNKEIRRLWHDFNNHISCLDMLLEMNNVERAREYMKSLKATGQTTYTEIKTNNQISDAVINQKYIQAKEKGILFTCKGKLQEEMGISEVELCALLSNSLDNAIEACEKVSEEKDKQITINLSLQGNLLQISVENTVQAPIGYQKHLLTTKEDKVHHGIGTQTMRHIVESHKGMMEWRCIDHVFKLNLVLEV